MQNEEEISFENDIELNSQGLTPTDEFAKIRMEGYSVEIIDTISKAWEITKNNLGVMVSYTAVCVFAYITLLFMVSRVYFVAGWVVLISVMSFLWGGFFAFLVKEYQLRRLSFTTFFEGFKYAGNLAISNLVVMLFMILPFLVMTFLMDIFSVFFSSFISFNYASNDWRYLLIASPTLLIFVFYLFAPILIVAAKMSFWTAMETSRKLVWANYFGVLGFFMGLVAINLLGMVFLGIGLFVSISLSFASIFVLYVKLIEKNGGGTGFCGDFYGDENAPLDAF